MHVMKALALFLLWTLSLTAEAATKPENCRIRIRVEQVNGERHQITFGTKLASRRECERLAKMHTPNFDPERVSRKNVSFSWRSYR